MSYHQWPGRYAIRCDVCQATHAMKFFEVTALMAGGRLQRRLTPKQAAPFAFDALVNRHGFVERVHSGLLCKECDLKRDLTGSLRVPELVDFPTAARGSEYRDETASAAELDVDKLDEVARLMEAPWPRG